MSSCENFRMIFYDIFRMTNNEWRPKAGIKFKPDNMLKYV